jgi:predicted nucleic acid-binding protein
MSAICVDSGFLMGLYDDRDQYHARANDLFVAYFSNSVNRLLVPWPVLYETVSTRLVRRQKSVALFERDWRLLTASRQLIFLDDSPYRQAAIDECLYEVRVRRRELRPLSLTDRVIRRILEETRIKVDVFITFNVGDFADLCNRLRLHLAS